MRDSLFSYLSLLFIIVFIFYILLISHDFYKMKQEVGMMYSVYGSYKRI
jgi:hypothetical protein